ncbi:hypothetical protein BH10BAC5_BH10BAC5_27430 [soil metagenome]
MKKLFILIIVSIFSTSYAQDKCGTDRWDVKTLTDSASVKIDLSHAAYSTVFKQTQLASHNEVKGTTPRLEQEKKVYKIRCWLIEFKSEDDRDYHLVIRDNTRNVTMVAEICDPTCPGVVNSPAYENFIKVREKFETYFAHKKSKKNITNCHIQIEGVGFYDKEHGVSPTGNADNNREIHPITKFTFLKN